MVLGVIFEALGFILEDFWRALGSLFLSFDGLGKQLDSWMDAGWPRSRPEGPQDPEHLPRGWLKIFSWGPTVSRQEG